MGCTYCKDYNDESHYKANRSSTVKIKKLTDKVKAKYSTEGPVDHYIQQCVYSGCPSPSTSYKNLMVTPENSIPIPQEEPPSPGRPTPFEKIGNRLKTPTLLYNFDTLNNVFCWYDFKKKQWKQNSLKKAKVDGPHKVGSLMKKELLKNLNSFSTIAVSDRKVHLIGIFHFEYDLKFNLFHIKPVCAFKRTSSTLFYGDGQIYSISGEYEGEYITKCERYDIVNNYWVPMPDIPTPHVNASAICFLKNDNISSLDYKLIVLGGYASKKPLLYNPNLNIFDPKTNQWATSNLEDFISEVPRFINTAIVQTAKGKIYLLGSYPLNDCFELDLEGKKLIKKGQIPQTDKTEYRMLQTFALNENDEVDILFTNNLSESLIIKGTNSMNCWEDSRANTFVVSLESKKQDSPSLSSHSSMKFNRLLKT